MSPDSTAPISASSSTGPASPPSFPTRSLSISSAATSLDLPYPPPFSSSSHLSDSMHQNTSSVPPTPRYTPKVSFDTFENTAASMFSFTLQVKSDGYKRSRHTRVFLCASSPEESGREALDWSLESLVQDGDELIIFRGVDEDALVKPHDVLRGEARELMKYVQEKSVEYDPQRKLSLILEYIAGKITDSLDRLIALYRPDSVVVGTRGRRWQAMGIGIGIGSISRYCLSHSPVPVIVVRPERKTRKAMEKRKADPKRGQHFE
ncbi:hypothetical protein AX15_005086 [Amanita polypyramis BW_CC]|nr:hypothetical protein AX15_005086 [Amanita polypyramis BW_CC]